MYGLRLLTALEQRSKVHHAASDATLGRQLYFFARGFFVERDVGIAVQFGGKPIGVDLVERHLALDPERTPSRRPRRVYGRISCSIVTY